MMQKMLEMGKTQGQVTNEQIQSMQESHKLLEKELQIANMKNEITQLEQQKKQLQEDHNQELKMMKDNAAMIAKRQNDEIERLVSDKHDSN